VGKSTLFNRITGGRRAIVHSAPGVTRDIQRGEADWAGVSFEVTDTGGLFSGVDDDLITMVEQKAIKEAMQSEAMIFVADGQSGMTPSDADVANKIRSSGIPVLVAVNKTESFKNRHTGGEFYKLGFENVYEISALHGEGIGDLLDVLVGLLPRFDPGDLQPDLKLAVVGVPNVGKSSLVNALVGEETNIVDERPGTTRDSIDIAIKWHNRRITLVDTAGIKRKSRSRDGVTILSALKSLETIKRCDVTVLMLDASRKISNQDVKVGSYVHKGGKGVLACFNKWDLVEKSNKTYREYEKDFHERFGFMSYSMIKFISALDRQRVDKIFPTAWKIKEEREKRIPTAEFNKFVEELCKRLPPPFYGGGTGKVYYGTQVDIGPPTFTLFVNKSAYFGRNYLRFINNQIREKYSFEGTHIRVKLMEKPQRGVSEH
jgi:GTP-binding protein